MDIGVDIVETRRVRKAIRRSPGFLKRIFTEEEISYCRRHKDPWPHFAARFAAKEAVWKALGRADLALMDIGVERDSRGKPSVWIRGKWARGLKLSHTRPSLP